MTPFTVTAGAFKAFRSDTQPGVCVGRERGKKAGYMCENNDNTESL